MAEFYFALIQATVLARAEENPWKRALALWGIGALLEALGPAAASKLLEGPYGRSFVDSTTPLSPEHYFDLARKTMAQAAGLEEAPSWLVEALDVPPEEVPQPFLMQDARAKTLVDRAIRYLTAHPDRIPEAWEFVRRQSKPGVGGLAKARSMREAQETGRRNAYAQLLSEALRSEALVKLSPAGLTRREILRQAGAALVGQALKSSPEVEAAARRFFARREAVVRRFPHVTLTIGNQPPIEWRFDPERSSEDLAEEFGRRFRDLLARPHDPEATAQKERSQREPLSQEEKGRDFLRAHQEFLTATVIDPATDAVVYKIDIQEYEFAQEWLAAHAIQLAREIGFNDYQQFDPDFDPAAGLEEGQSRREVLLKALKWATPPALGAGMGAIGNWTVGTIGETPSARRRNGLIGAFLSGAFGFLIGWTAAFGDIDRKNPPRPRRDQRSGLEEKPLAVLQLEPGLSKLDQDTQRLIQEYVVPAVEGKSSAQERSEHFYKLLGQLWRYAKTEVATQALDSVSNKAGLSALRQSHLGLALYDLLQWINVYVLLPQKVAADLVQPRFQGPWGGRFLERVSEFRLLPVEGYELFRMHKGQPPVAVVYTTALYPGDSRADPLINGWVSFRTAFVRARPSVAGMEHSRTEEMGHIVDIGRRRELTPQATLPVFLVPFRRSGDLTLVDEIIDEIRALLRHLSGQRWEEEYAELKSLQPVSMDQVNRMIRGEVRDPHLLARYWVGNRLRGIAENSARYAARRLWRQQFKDRIGLGIRRIYPRSQPEAELQLESIAVSQTGGLEEARRFLGQLGKEALLGMVPIVVGEGLRKARPELEALAGLEDQGILLDEEGDAVIRVVEKWYARRVVYAGLEEETADFVRQAKRFGIDTTAVDPAHRDFPQLIAALLGSAAGLEQAAVEAREDFRRFMDDLRSLTPRSA
ncbi:MAG: hypothetical protein HYZ90_04655 [Candidatus Omnitrophica bacterium]|nr:hypothetical protein [Candidatus Omnitrophota bacterium]